MRKDSGPVSNKTKKGSKIDAETFCKGFSPYKDQLSKGFSAFSDKKKRTPQYILQDTPQDRKGYIQS